MCNVSVRVRIQYAGEILGCSIGFNGSEYRCRYQGRVYKARTLLTLKRFISDLFLAAF